MACSQNINLWICSLLALMEKNLAMEVRMHLLGFDETKIAAMGASKDFGIVWMSIVRQLMKVLADGPNPSMKILHLHRNTNGRPDNVQELPLSCL